MKNPAIVLGAAMILMSSMQFAVAAPKHHQSRTHQVIVRQQPRDVGAYAYWPDARPNRYDSGPIYSGGYSAPAGR
jgi:hypothetical protein